MGYLPPPNFCQNLDLNPTKPNINPAAQNFRTCSVNKEMHYISILLKNSAIAEECISESEKVSKYEPVREKDISWADVVKGGKSKK